MNGKVEMTVTEEALIGLGFRSIPKLPSFKVNIIHIIPSLPSPIQIVFDCSRRVEWSPVSCLIYTLNADIIPFFFRFRRRSLPRLFLWRMSPLANPYWRKVKNKMTTLSKM